MKIEVKVVVCDWGVFINDELSKDLIFNSKANAEEVKRIIELDIENKRFDSVHPKINIAKSEEHMLNQFRKDHERPPLLKLADDWQKIADVSNELAARIERVLGDKK